MAKLKKCGKYDEVPRVSVEKLDPTPLKTKILLDGPIPIELRLRELIQSERMAQYARQQGVETFEEANDFDIPDDPIPQLDDELVFDVDLGRDVTRIEKRALDEERAIHRREHIAKKRRIARKKATVASNPPAPAPAQPPSTKTP